MLGRETATPLDILYEMPDSWKKLPRHEWVWILKDRMEKAHAVVRDYSEQSIKRQKHYHDMKMSFERFKVGDKVYVFFPQKKVGCSSKLTSFWRGPFDVMAKLSEVLYRVNCGGNGKDQVIHCDRMKVCKKQLLRGEVDGDGGTQSPEGHESVGKAEQNCQAEIADMLGYKDKGLETVEDLAGGSENKRVRRPPAWLKDFVRD